MRIEALDEPEPEPEPEPDLVRIGLGLRPFGPGLGLGLDRRADFPPSPRGQRGPQRATSSLIQGTGAGLASRICDDHSLSSMRFQLSVIFSK